MSLENDQNDRKSSPSSPSTGSEHQIKVEPKSDPVLDTVVLPKLRLNITLASDPALQPEAKDIKGIRGDGRQNHRQMQHCDLMDDGDDEDGGGGGDGVDDRDIDRRSNMSGGTPPSPSNTMSPRLIPSPQQPAHPVVIVPNPEVAMGRMPAFMCGPCGIKFSSMSTLEAHQTYYCSHR